MTDGPGIPSDFAFKDRRDYINSTSLALGFLEAVASVGAGAALAAPRLDVTCVRMVSTNGRFRVIVSNDPPVPDSAASVRYRLFDGRATVWGVFEPDAASTILRRVPTRRQVIGLEATGTLSGRCRIPCPTFEDMLENAVEATKRLHLQAPDIPATAQVVNTYLKNVPTTPPDDAEPVALVIENRSVRQVRDATLSLSAVTLPAFHKEAFEIAFLVRY
jgi:hypothetical protein